MEMSKDSITALRQLNLQQSSPVLPSKTPHVRIQSLRETDVSLKNDDIACSKSVKRTRKLQQTTGSKTPVSAYASLSGFLEEEKRTTKRRMSEFQRKSKPDSPTIVQSPLENGDTVVRPMMVPYFDPVTVEELDESDCSNGSQVLQNLAFQRKLTAKRPIVLGKTSLPPVSPTVQNRSMKPLVLSYLECTAPVLTSTYDLLKRKGKKQTGRLR